ncbi:hypothetical protein [Rhodococcus sp. 11-3]|uniref:hypothetical protein n=1 Tax=Rhodococcus sp. 11-3 TaxID=2854796 RepID=UPI002041C25F|nr:hypothetical protein [Rhodococcus sp. 11-3]USC17035.1 hypothetical protein KZJ41_09285 [Rhodococcus sp. 11-3]
MGAIGDPYVSLNEIKAYLKVNETQFSLDDKLTLAVQAASRKINACCGRQFGRTSTATARLYEPSSLVRLEVDDFHTTDELVVEVDSAGAGTFDQVWSSTDYELSPRNGIVDGEPGWPYHEIHAVGGKRFPDMRFLTRCAVVRVTAQWGWAEVPGPIKQATLILASQLHKLAEAPHGVIGFGQFGEVRVKDIPQVYSLIHAYARDETFVW